MHERPTSQCKNSCCILSDADARCSSIDSCSHVRGTTWLRMECLGLQSQLPQVHFDRCKFWHSLIHNGAIVHVGPVLGLVQAKQYKVVVISSGARECHLCQTEVSLRRACRVGSSIVAEPTTAVELPVHCNVLVAGVPLHTDLLYLRSNRARSGVEVKGRAMHWLHLACWDEGRIRGKIVRPTNARTCLVCMQQWQNWFAMWMMISQPGGVCAIL